tara:strand:+ start:1523 stop:1810 length:288 start_codon:yes stop_codon:yes gene_type:complete
MTARKAKRHINESEDFLVLTRVKNIINVDTHNNDSVNIILDLAVANKNFLELLKSVIKSVDEYTNEEDTDKSGTDRPEEPEVDFEGEIQEAQIVD